MHRVFAAFGCLASLGCSPIRSVIPSSSALAALLNPYLLARSVADVTDEATLAVDFSDISKEFGGGGIAMPTSSTGRSGR